MDPLTSFDGSVSWGHVGLLIFHNSPVKTAGGPIRTHTQTADTLLFSRFYDSTRRHLPKKVKFTLPVGRSSARAGAST